MDERVSDGDDAVGIRFRDGSIEERVVGPEIRCGGGDVDGDGRYGAFQVADGGGEHEDVAGRLEIFQEQFHARVHPSSILL